MTFEPGTVVGIPFRFSDRPGAKMRPALVLSTKQSQAATHEVIVCAITSNMGDAAYSVALATGDFSSGKLPKPSRVKVGSLVSIHESRVERSWGQLKPAVMRQVWKEFYGLFPSA